MNHYISLAKSAVENYVKEGKSIEPPSDLPKEFYEKRAGTFVTIKKGNDLRGCIGTYLPTRPTIVEEIIRNAIAAATEDCRFGSVKKEELSSLSYEVYILSEPEPVEDIKTLDPKKFGIIVKTTPFAYPNQDVVFDGRTPLKSGLLLPDLQGIDTVEEQFILACQKGQIDPAKEKTFTYRFTVEKHQ
jgi:AmmeMemoRadiSam system protein A